jgi:hypothetical protein
MRKGYIVLAQAFEYNDEYFSSLDNAYQTVSIAYATRERAEKEAKKVNVEHAYQVAGDLRDWTYGGPAGEMFRHEPEEDVLELARKVFDDPPESFKDALDKFDELDELPLDRVDLEWLVKTFSVFRCAFVSEIEIEEEVIG